MNADREDWIKSYFEELQVTISAADYVQVDPLWRHNHHLNTNNCFYFIQDGEGEIQVGNEIINPSPGQLVFLPDGETISYRTSMIRPFRKYYCHFHATANFLSLFQLIHLPKCMTLLNLEERNGLEKRFTDLIAAVHQDNPIGKIRVKSIMYEMICFLLERQGSYPELPLSPSIMKWNAVLKYMEQHLYDQTTIERIAAVFNYNPKYLARSFKSSFGVSPHRYMDTLRLKQARKLLLSTQSSLSEIADAIGMDRSQFSKWFKKYSDVSPHQFRSTKMMGRSLVGKDR